MLRFSKARVMVFASILNTEPSIIAITVVSLNDREVHVRVRVPSRSKDDNLRREGKRKEPKEKYEIQ